MAKLLITGASGLLGANLVLGAVGRHEITAICHNNLIHLDDVEVISADLTNRETTHAVIADSAPDWVIHCAAETNVDHCEQDPERAFLFNRDMPRWVAQATRKAGGRIIHISTDAVFDGSRSGYREADSPLPTSVYGQSKLEGEKAVLEEDPQAIIVRTNFYGWNAQDKNSLAEWFLSKLELRQPCRGFSDVYVKLLLVNDLVDLLLRMMESECEGIYHVLGRDCVSKHDFGLHLARTFHLEPDLIEPIEVDELGLLAPRARNLCLDTSKISSALDRELPSLEDGLSKFYKLRETGFSDRIKSLLGVQNHEGN